MDGGNITHTNTRHTHNLYILYFIRADLNGGSSENICVLTTHQGSKGVGKHQSGYKTQCQAGDHAHVLKRIW